MSPVAFTRTPPGLSNQAAFLGVDLIVFTEGGEVTYTVPDVETGLDNGETHDSMFWRVAIDSFAPADKTFHIKSVGSKLTVQAIAEMIERGAVTKAVAAMDRDLDFFRRKLIRHTNVLYTHGYSWENDLWTLDVSSNVLAVFLPDKRQHQAAHTELELFFIKLEQVFKTAVRLDRSLASAGLDPLHRDSMEGVVRPDPPRSPAIQRDDLAALIRATRNANPAIRPHLSRGDILRDLHGHSLAKAVVSLVRNLAQELGKHRLSNSLLTAIALTQFKNSQNLILGQYQGPVQAIIW